MNNFKTTRRKGTVLKLTALTSTALVGLVLAPSAYAQTQWSGGVSTDWFDKLNWNPTAVPTAATDVTVDDMTFQTPTITGTNKTATAENLIIGNAKSATLNVENGATLKTSQGVLGYLAGSNGVMNIGIVPSASLTHWVNSGSLAVGRLGSATLNIGNATVSNASAIIAIGFGSTGVVNVSGANATWTNDGNLMVSMYGTANLNVTNGGHVDSTSATIGGYHDSKGTALVTGLGSTWAAGSLMTVGAAGTGTLSIANKGTVTGVDAIIGDSAIGVGDVTVDGTGSTWLNSGDVVIGNGGKGTVTLSNGGQMGSASGTIGALGPGAAMVTGSGSIWSNGGELHVGGTGKGTLDIMNSGKVFNSGVLHVGSEQGSTGAVTVDGMGSSLTGSGSFLLAVGDGGTGNLSIQNGGYVFSAGGIVGRNEGSSGTVALAGSDSSWLDTGDLTVGSAGSGVLDVSDGAYLASSIGYAGFDAKGLGTITVRDMGSTWSATSIAIGVSGTGTLNILDGGHVTDSDGSKQRILGGLAGSYGTANVAGVGSSWKSSNVDFVVGGSGTGTLNITSGATVSDHTAYVGEHVDGVGLVTVDGAGSIWSNNGSLYVGNDGAGVLNVANGGVVNAGFTAFGSSAGATGNVKVDGTGSAVAATGNLTVGSFGTSTMIVSNGGAVSNLDGTMGAAAGANGTAIVRDAGSKWISDGNLIVGAGGNAALSILDGGMVTAKFAIIGFQAGGTGSVLVKDAGSIWTSNSDIGVGVFGQGSLAISNGAVASSTAGNNYAGTQAGSSGTVTVDGVGSLWTTSKTMVIGNAGVGSLVVTDGGSAHDNQGIIANIVGSTGVATIDGIGSTWTNSADLSVGRVGTGQLKVVNGGGVTNVNGYVGQFAGAYGIVTVEGAGSTWANTGNLVVGDAGAGSLWISGGTVTVGGTLTLAKSAGSKGDLNIGGGGAPGTLNAASVQFGLGTGAINFNHSSANHAFGATIAGLGTINQSAGITHLTADSSGFTGATHVLGGTLLVDGKLGTGAIDVQSGGTLGGIGTIGGGVTIAAGGTLTGYQGQMLSMGGLTLASGANVDVTLGSPGGNALFDVAGNLMLDGTLNITSTGQFGPGVYKLMSYGGTLTDNGLDIGATPDGNTAADFLVQTSVAGQVNLVNSALPNMLFWDGDMSGSAGNNTVDGGTGSWSNTSANWTDANGATNGVMHPQPGFAIFQGAAGTVTVDASAGDVAVTGMQFASDGYAIAGAPVILAKPDTTIRVGDGSASGADYTATLSSILTGSGGLVKTDLGTLILTGANDYAGGTIISGGTLQLGNGGASGSVAGDIVNNGTLVFNRSDASSFAGQISGMGLLVQQGPGKTNLTGDSSAFTGGVRVDGGTLTVINGGKLNSNSVYLGVGTGSNGALLLDGAASSLTSGGALVVGGQGSASLAIGGGATMTVGEAILGNSGGSSGTALIDGMDSKLVTGDVYVGGGGAGQVTVSNGGTLLSADGYVGYDPSVDAAVMVTGAGSTWTGNSIGIGVNGTGTLNIVNGGVVTDGGANDGGVIGAGAGSKGFANVAGAGSAWINNGDFYVGAAGNGSLNLAAGGKVTSAEAYIGFAAGSTGSATIDGAGSTWTSSGSLSVGRDGNGKLVMSNGAVVSDNIGYIGFGTGTSGNVTVDGKGSSWSNTQGVVIGVSGTGNLTIANGAKVDGAAAIVAAAAGSTGTIAVDGAGSAWLNTGDLTVGDLGNATVTVAHGGTVTNATAYIAYGAGSTGSVVIDGAGSTWTNKDLAIGGLGAGTLTITNGGAVRNDIAAVASAAGVNSKVIVDGAGSSWTSNGLAIIGQFGNGTLTIANGGIVTVGGPLALATAAGSTGVLNIGAAGASPAAVAGTLNAASLQFGSGTGILNFNHTSPNYAFAVAMAGAGTINQLAGVTNLTGNSSGFSGLVNVTGGKLYVNGSLAGGMVSLGSGAVLGGNGVIGGLTTQSGAIVAPGNSIGTLNIAGNAAFAAGSIYQVELGGAGQSDLIKVSGTAAISNGALLTVTKTGAVPYALGTRYTVLTADGGLMGKFTIDNVQLTNFVGLVSGSDAKSFFIDVAKTKAFASAALTPNQQATAKAIDGMPLNSTLVGAVAGLMSDAAAQGAFDQLSGEIHASAKGVLIEDSRFVRDAALDRLRATGATGSVWGRALGGWDTHSGDGNAATIKSTAGGLLLGTDAMPGGKVRIGALGAYNRSTFRVNARNSAGSSDNYGVGVYAGARWDGLALRVGAAYSWSALKTKRMVNFGGFSDTLSAKYDADTAQAFGELGYAIKAGEASFEPFANLAYIRLSTNAFAEKGGAAALAGAEDTHAVTFTTLGTRASTGFALGDGGMVTAHGTFGWRHAFDPATGTAVKLAGSTLFDIGGVPVARDMGVADLGLDLQVRGGTTLGLSYNGQFGSGSAGQTVRATASFKF